jgi:hypothetical protein
MGHVSFAARGHLIHVVMTTDYQVQATNFLVAARDDPRHSTQSVMTSNTSVSLFSLACKRRTSTDGWMSAISEPGPDKPSAISADISSFRRRLRAPFRSLIGLSATYDSGSSCPSLSLNKHVRTSYFRVTVPARETMQRK